MLLLLFFPGALPLASAGVGGYVRIHIYIICADPGQSWLPQEVDVLQVHQVFCPPASIYPCLKRSPYEDITEIQGYTQRQPLNNGAYETPFQSVFNGATLSKALQNERLTQEELVDLQLGVPAESTTAGALEFKEDDKG